MKYTLFFIGYTFHDYKVKKLIGTKCIFILIDNQNFDRFNLESKALIVKDFLELKELFNSKKSLLVNNLNVGTS
jgi:hypothetical protein